jgi:hypothetical protein
VKSSNTAQPFSVKLNFLSFYILIWLISGLALGINAYRIVPYYQNPVKNGIEFEGRLTGIDAGEFAHTLHYVYNIDGVAFNGKGTAGYGNPEIKDLKKGDKIIVFYDSHNFGNSVAGNPERLSEHQKHYTWAIERGGSMPTVIFILFARSGQKWILRNGIQNSEAL